MRSLISVDIHRPHNNTYLNDEERALHRSPPPTINRRIEDLMHFDNKGGHHTMKRLIISACAVLFLAIPTWAQDEHPSWEIPVSFSFNRADFFLVKENLLGFQFDVDYNFNKTIGLTINFAGQSKTIAGVELGTGQFLLGPRFTKRAKRATVFSHVLIGSYAVSLDDGINPKITDDGRALGLGGGIDVNAGRLVAIRVVQFDYIPHKIGGTWLHDARLGFGVVFKFGY